VQSSASWCFQEKYQHTTINIDCVGRWGRAAVVLEDGGGAAGLGGGVGRRFKIVAAALGSSGNRRIWDNGIGISIVKA
jgi:hypothetical protein